MKHTLNTGDPARKLVEASLHTHEEYEVHMKALFTQLRNSTIQEQFINTNFQMNYIKKLTFTCTVLTG